MVGNNSSSRAGFSSRLLPEAAEEVLYVENLTGLQRYQLITSLVVPRPIGWLSTRSLDGVRNLAPFSFFAALSASPMLVGVSIGHRRDRLKDTLQNIRETGSFCANVVTVAHLDSMNMSSADVSPTVDEFEHVGLQWAEAATVDAPYVADCPAVLECRLFKEVDLSPAPNGLVIGEVTGLRISPELPRLPGTDIIDTEYLRPVGRLWGRAYSLPGEVLELARPEVDD
ncbi:MAG: flavin reductase family protein [Gemmatimonadota bacterium]